MICLIGIHLSIATTQRERQRSLQHQHFKREKTTQKSAENEWPDLEVRAFWLRGDLKTEEFDDCDLGDCAEPEGLSLSSHQGLITADC